MGNGFVARMASVGFSAMRCSDCQAVNRHPIHARSDSGRKWPALPTRRPAARPAVLGRGHRRCPLRRWRGRLKAGLVVTRLLRLDMHMTGGRWSAASQGRVLGQVPLRCGQLCWHAPGSRRGPGCWVPRRGAAHPWGRTPACVAQQASAGAGAQGRRLLFALLRCAAWLTFTPTLAPASASQLMTARP